MKPVSVQELRRGPDAEPAEHQSALVEDSTGRRWVVVAPLTPVASAELERNDPLVRQLARHLPFKVPAAAGYASVGVNGRAAVFPYVEGSTLNLHRLPAGPGLASAVGRAVAAVHNIAQGLFEEFGVPAFDAAAHRARRLSELDRAAETGRVPTGLLARWEQAFEAPALWRFATTPVHGSLDGWAFRVAFSDDDAATGRIVALTNWGQAAVTDPAEDFAVLVHQATPAAVDSVLESYALARSHRPDPHLLSRARLASEMRLIRGLAAAVAAGDDVTVQAKVDQLRKLDRLTSADDSLVPQDPLEPAVEVSRETGAAALSTVDAAAHADPGDGEPVSATEVAGDEWWSEADPTDVVPSTDVPSPDDHDSDDHDPDDDDSDDRPGEVGLTGDGDDHQTPAHERDLAGPEAATDEGHLAGDEAPLAERDRADKGVLAGQGDLDDVGGHRPDGSDLAGEDDLVRDTTESIPVVRLGEGLDDRTRLHDLYGMPEEALTDGADGSSSDSPDDVGAGVTSDSDDSDSDNEDSDRGSSGDEEPPAVSR